MRASRTPVKKLWWLVALFALATAVREGLDYFGPMARAYRAYVDEASAQVRAHRGDARFQEIEGAIINVGYRLESADRQDDGSVLLVVVEAVQFQTFSESGPFGNRRVAQTRQHVEMSQVEGRWVVSDLREETTEVKDLSSVAADAP
jgi:hypothetical protein